MARERPGLADGLGQFLQVVFSKCWRGLVVDSFKRDSGTSAVLGGVDDLGFHDDVLLSSG